MLNPSCKKHFNDTLLHSLLVKEWLVFYYIYRLYCIPYHLLTKWSVWWNLQLFRKSTHLFPPSRLEPGVPPELRAYHGHPFSLSCKNNLPHKAFFHGSYLVCRSSFPCLPWQILRFGKKSNVLEINKASEKNRTRGVTCQKKTNKAYKQISSKVFFSRLTHVTCHQALIKNFALFLNVN